jgi:hypothetical protein
MLVWRNQPAGWQVAGLSLASVSGLGKYSELQYFLLHFFFNLPPLREAAFQDQIQIFKHKIYLFLHTEFLC